jgi:hypothetical protein
MDWYEFAQKHRVCEIRSEQDLLYQVGKTVGGKVISDEQFSALADSIRQGLSLSQEDVVLDLCCGNGVLTKQLSPFVAQIHAVDFSQPYIANARQFCSASNITYYSHDVMKIQSLALEKSHRPITKALLYDALAYLDQASLARLLQDLGETHPQLREVMLGSVFFQPLKWRFFNTASRKLRYLFVIKLMGRNHGIGTWWSQAQLRRAAAAGGFPQVEIKSQPALLHTAHYRIDALLHRPEASRSGTASSAAGP